MYHHIISNTGDKELFELFHYINFNNCKSEMFGTGWRGADSNGNYAIPMYEHRTKKLYNVNGNGTEMTIMNEIFNRWDNAPSFAKRCFFSALASKYLKSDICIITEEIKPFLEKWDNKKEIELVKIHGLDFHLIGSGTKRKVYKRFDCNYVYKIPHEDCQSIGFEENIREAKIYRENKYTNPIYAQCELLGDNILQMEYVQPVYFTKDDVFPDWVLTIADCQVGYNREGKLVAYDYGSDI